MRMGGVAESDGGSGVSSLVEDELSVNVLEQQLNEEEDQAAELQSEDVDCFGSPDELLLLGHDRAKKDRSLDVQNTGDAARLTFEDLGLRPEIVLGLSKGRFFVPSPVQVKAIPYGKFGYDLIMQAKSGTGKTCAFGTIVLQQLDLTPDSAGDIQAIILAPTREIADQNLGAVKCIGSEMLGLRAKAFIGGTSVQQSKRRSKNCNVVSGTPGRILHMIQSNEMDVSKVRIVVLDEADRLMESSFIVDIEAILEAVPGERQVIAASATYPEGLKGFVGRFMRGGIDVTVDVGVGLLSVELFAVDVGKVLGVGRGGGGSSNNTEEVIGRKMEVLLSVLVEVPYNQAIVFSRSLLKAQKIYDFLKDEHLDVSLLTGALDQHTRLSALRNTKEGKCKILVASDLATRGIDIEGVDLVINFEVPDEPSTFVHRFGRAGRFGSSGISITLMTFLSERRALSELISGSNLSISVIESKEQLRGLGRGRLQKLFSKKEVLRVGEKGNEGWKEVLENVVVGKTESLLSYPSAGMDSFAGFKLAVDFSGVLGEVEGLEAL